jgi:hypothetical protein
LFTGYSLVDTLLTLGQWPLIAAISRDFSMRAFSDTQSLRVGLLFLLATTGLVVTSPSQANDVVHQFDFGGEPTTPARNVLASMNFLLKQDATDEHKINLYHTKDALHVQVDKPAFGIIVHEQDIPGANHIRLHWGVSTYPQGASYEHGVDNEAIMVYVFFGHEKYSSGSMFVPDSPYFIGFFLCPKNSDRLAQPYAGHYYKKTGRFICVDHPGQGMTAISELNLADEFQKSFGLNSVPPISGISIEVDTTSSKNDGKAAAFLQRIEFLK